MALDFKYRIHEVAKDFGMTSKDISQILTDYATTPKNHMQVLDDAELDIIFEYLTQHHQVDRTGYCNPPLFRASNPYICINLQYIDVLTWSGCPWNEICTYNTGQYILLPGYSGCARTDTGTSECNRR